MAKWRSCEYKDVKRSLSQKKSSCSSQYDTDLYMKTVVGGEGHLCLRG